MSRENSESGPVALAVQADGWRRVTPSPSAEMLKAFYAGEYFQASHGTYAQAIPRREIDHRGLLARLMLAAIAEGCGGKGGGSLLEIGCGEGWFLAAADAGGYAVQGIDSRGMGSAASTRGSSTGRGSATPSRSSTA